MPPRARRGSGDPLEDAVALSELAHFCERRGVGVQARCGGAAVVAHVVDDSAVEGEHVSARAKAAHDVAERREPLLEQRAWQLAVFVGSAA